MLPRSALVSLAMAVGLLTASCGGPAPAESAPVSAVQVIEAGDHQVIDVRTPEEFGAGHVVGAENIDVQAPDFADAVAQLDPEAGYVVYCRTGSRSAAAADAMRGMGFAEVVDAGGFDALVEAGVPTS